MLAVGLFFAGVPDPRASNARHDLSELLFIAFAAVLCGAENCQDMADFGEAKRAALGKVLRLAHGTPSHDTFSRVFRLLDPAAFEAAFRRFTAAFAAALSGTVGLAGQVVAIDGKSLAGAFEVGAQATPLHLVTAWAADQRLVLAQRRAPGRSEITAALEIIGLLDLQACTVTADALHGNRRMAQAIREQGGDYLLALKGNRGPLYHAAVALLDAAPVAAVTRTAKPAHARHEERRAAVVPVPQDWPERFKFNGLAAVARIDALRNTAPKGAEVQSRYFVLSRLLPADEVLHVARRHWSIENQQHWLLDVVFDEDSARARKDHAAENIALLRRLALNLLQSDTLKASIRRKIKQAGWKDDYLFSLLAQMR
ncbi:MAG: ISAs1 family transposase [Proteobacteria bacterium]|nr:ISAs1 family transposase [Pseudomonadota bacterium]